MIYNVSTLYYFEVIMKKVMIATPCLDQKIHVFYMHSLCQTIKMAASYDIDLYCVFLTSESILPMARNELFNAAYEESFDSMVFIDSDEQWNPETLFDILNSPKDVVAAPVVNKQDDKEVFNVLMHKNYEIDETDGYVVADRVGTGFLKMSKKVIVDLYESNMEVFFRGKNLKNICEYTIDNGSFVSEDYTLSRKIKELGYKIWINPNDTISHVGSKVYTGNFYNEITQTK